ncbi:hypothetical protein [Bartonella tamiae]|uniref:Uncharacterized protein n=1 Tax=Bartonella tamiae Th239 TaxID=1094558 RepID=J0R155_9HYPH|nr:hypothetical protein [Bartonella tamiae]EJF89279.1 hypothetical protein ME5_01830 [Bartonella tamiae Th239]EJF95559.1 hypothetical protein MEG_00049 [Bartonella tamiae Th307]
MFNICLFGQAGWASFGVTEVHWCRMSVTVTIFVDKSWLLPGVFARLIIPPSHVPFSLRLFALGGRIGHFYQSSIKTAFITLHRYFLIMFLKSDICCGLTLILQNNNQLLKLRSIVRL